MLKLIDTHAHIEEFQDIHSVVNRARGVGVAAIIAVGTSHESNQKVLDICHKYPNFVYPALGLHPYELGRLQSHEIDRTLRFIEERTSDIVAIGEVGLDYDRRVLKTSSKERQKEVFKLILRLAIKHKKPVIIHARYSWKDCLEIVRDFKIEKAIFHWFAGPSRVLQDLLQADYFVSATPASEYHEEHRQAIEETPMDNLLLETDCPVAYGRELKYTSEPADILRTLEAVAALKAIDRAEVAHQTTYNASNFFGLVPS